jgi:hypothetical protein
VTDHLGTTHFAKNVQLLQDADVRPGQDKAFAEWMPYQTAQAKKHEETEKAALTPKEPWLADAKALEARQREEFEAKAKALLEKSNAPSPLPPPPEPAK